MVTLALGGVQGSLTSLTEPVLEAGALAEAVAGGGGGASSPASPGLGGVIGNGARGILPGPS